MTTSDQRPNLRLALLGGEGLRSQSASLWQSLANDSTIGVLPVALTSLPLSQYERRTQITRSQLSEFGISTTLIPPDGDSAAINGNRIIYLPGGDQRAVVEKLRDSTLWNTLTSTNSTERLLIASGGAAVALGDLTFAPIKPYPAALDDLEFEILAGLGLLKNIVVLPYFSWLQEEVIAKIRALAPQAVMLGIDDQAALISHPDGWEVSGLGIVSVYHPDRAPHLFDPASRIPPDVLAPHP